MARFIGPARPIRQRRPARPRVPSPALALVIAGLAAAEVDIYSYRKETPTP